MTDHYDELGAAPDATPAELRRAYRSRARVLHPDAAGDAAAMRRLNEAWRVLGDAEARRRYDEALGLAPGPGGDGPEDDVPPRRHGSTPFARPGLWFAMVVVLLVIFVFTAYAGGGSGAGGGGRLP